MVRERRSSDRPDTTARLNRHDRLGTVALAFALTVLGALGTAWIAQAVLATERGQRWDQTAMRSVAVPGDLTGRTIQALETVTVGATAVALLVCLSLAAVRRRWAHALAAVIVVVPANITTQVLKHQVLTREDYGYGTVQSLPSGHATVVVSLALAAVIVAPRIGRWLWASAAAAMSTLVGLAVVVGRWHRPSDVLAAMAVCLAWSGVAIAVAALVRSRPPAGDNQITGASRAAPTHGMVAWFGYLVLGLAGSIGVLAGARELGLYGIGTASTAALGAAGLLAIGLASSVLVASVVAALRRLDHR